MNRKLKTLTPIALVFLGLSIYPAVSQACYVNQPAEARVKRHYDAVVVFRVTRVKVYDRSSDGWDRQPPWEATGQIISIVSGKFKAKTVDVGRSGSSATCDDGHPPPKIGEQWVAYIIRDSDRFYAHESYPLTLSKRIDARFKGIPAH